jgi:hypothetical protein
VRGYADVEEAKQFEAMQYLNDRGVKYLTPSDSPVPRCVRLTFKGGAGWATSNGKPTNDPNERIGASPSND